MPLVKLNFIWFSFYWLHHKTSRTLVPWPGIKSVPSVVVQSPNHWTNREAPSLLLRFKSSICILDSSPLSNVSFANTFSQAEACLLDIVFRRTQVFIWWSPTYQLFLSLIMPFVLPLKSLPNPRLFIGFFLCYLLGVL